MPLKIGIRKEDKNIWERRAPLTPEQVRALRADGLAVAVQPSAHRTFKDQTYVDAGATIQKELADCQVVFAVKEIPLQHLLPNRTYAFFSHTVKGQHHNMPMLQRMLDLKCTLIDYEKVTDDQGRRLVFFGRHAGLAGMLDSLWALGRRLEHEGLAGPFSALQVAHAYPDLEAARAAVRAAGERLAQEGLPPGLGPLAFGFTGYGNVSRGAQEIFDLLPHRVVQPHELSQAASVGGARELVKVVFREEHMVTPLAGAFELEDYFQHPARYRGDFARFVPHLHVLINCIYWAPQFPRLVTRDLLHGLYGAGARPRLRVIGDISCDIEGAIECTLETTDPGNPVFTYLVEDDEIVAGVEGHGPVVLAVDNLPCELPLEASRDFGQALEPFVPAIARADYSAPYDSLALPPEIKRAVIVHQGQLAPAYAYLQDFLNGKEGGAL
jgi:alpha-aminoadipic semialdehyde synthase